MYGFLLARPPDFITILAPLQNNGGTWRPDARVFWRVGSEMLSYAFQASEEISFATQDEANDYAIQHLTMPWVEESKRLKAKAAGFPLGPW